MKIDIVNILYLIPCVGDGGIEAMIISWISTLNARRFRVDVFTQRITSQKTKKRLELLGAKVYSSECRNRNFKMKHDALINILRSKNYSIIHLHTCFSLEFFLLKWAYKEGIKIRIVHGHNVLENKHCKDIIIQKISQPFMRWYATEYLGCTDQAAIEILGKKGIKSTHYRRINNSIDTKRTEFSELDRNKIRSDLNLWDTYIIGHVGRMTEQKNHVFLLEIFAECLKMRENSILMLIGDGELKQHIHERAVQLGIEKKIIFIGVVSNVPLYLSAMDHFLFPSLYEGFSIALLEAQCNGLICTVSSEIVQEAIILDTTVPVSLAESAKKWAQIICNDRTIDNRHEAAKIIRDSGYDIKDNDLNDYYEKLLRSRKI